MGLKKGGVEEIIAAIKAGSGSPTCCCGGSSDNHSRADTSDGTSGLLVNFKGTGGAKEDTAPGGWLAGGRPALTRASSGDGSSGQDDSDDKSANLFDQFQLME